ncbi:hypothetical protein HNR01_001007 [Methylorubrum rhodesianum]|uniref:hypothetical protein n=1 Tax=Methylorubrum TaxID=2282523 RepID=UPI00160DEF20|nr:MULTISPECIES: hypothetical protein [Methylorubrum]MBB5761395.1 hypothetical protein [Methylorubrum rhodesianum]
MRVLIADDVFGNPENEVALNTILHIAVRKRCYLDAYQANGQGFAAWYQKLGKVHQQAWNDVSSWSVRDSGLYRLRTWIVTGTPDRQATPPRFTLEDAIGRVTRPMRIWIENDRNDRQFWLSHMRSDVRQFFLDMEQQRLVQFDSRGGLGELRMALQELFTRSIIDKHDSMVLFDSDAGTPGNISAEAALMTEFCQQASLRHHCLSRRAIENYIPKSALYAWVFEKGGKERGRRKKIVDAFFRMTPEQRYHFRLKSGWDSSPSPPVSALYSSVATADHMTLAQGIAGDIAMVYVTHHASIEAWAVRDGMDQGVQKTVDQLADWIRVPYA